MGKFSLVVLCVHVARSLLWLQPASGQRGAYKSTVVPQELLVLPDLPYDYDELEPFLDAATLEVHHRGHHRAYTSKINTALEKWREQDSHPDSLSHKSMVEILQRLSEVPKQWHTPVKNNAGGYLNHIFYWENMCPAPNSAHPTGTLAEDIESSFGSFAEFKAAFSEAGTRLFGSGYVWLCLNTTGPLLITSTQNQDCPLTSNLYPLLVLDVWEHAYYLQHQNKRADYIAAWWGVVCWDQVSSVREFWREYLVASDNTTFSHQEL